MRVINGYWITVSPHVLSKKGGISVSIDLSTGFNSGRQIIVIDIDVDELLPVILRSPLFAKCPAVRGKKGCKVFAILDPGQPMPSKGTIQYHPFDDSSQQWIEIFTSGKHALVHGEHPDSTPDSPIFYEVIRGFGAPFPVLAWEDIHREIVAIAATFGLINRDRRKALKATPTRNQTGGSITDQLGLKIEDVCSPIDAKLHGDCIRGSHPVHGSNSGSNLCISPLENAWYCFRCESGGGPLEWIAVEEGIIDCREAGPGCLEGKWKMVYSALERRGYNVSQFQKTNHRDTAKTAEDVDDKQKNKNINRRAFVEDAGRFCFTAMDATGQFHFCHFDGKEIAFRESVIVAGKPVYPQELPMKDGQFVRIVRVPIVEEIQQSKSLSAQELYNVIEQHLRTYIDIPALDLEMAVYYILFTWFYKKVNTVPYLRVIGDTGKGKSRISTVIADLCFLPITAEGASTPAGILRYKEKWHGTLKMDEADLKEGGFANELVKYINLGFERGKFFIKNDAADMSKQEFFDPFGPKVFAMREPFKDNATEGRVLSITARETTRKDIPILLPAHYETEVSRLQGMIARFVLEHWGDVDPERMIDCTDLPIEPRLKQLMMPLSLVLQVLPDGKDRFLTYMHRRQQDVKQTRAESYEGMLLNYAYALAAGDEEPGSEFFNLTQAGKLLAVTAKMVGDPLGLKPAAVTRALKSIGFETERFTLHVVAGDEEGAPAKRRQVRRLVVPDENTWREIIQRYYYVDDATRATDDLTHIECPRVLRGSKYDMPRTTCDIRDTSGEGGAALNTSGTIISLSSFAPLPESVTNATNVTSIQVQQNSTPDVSEPSGDISALMRSYGLDVIPDVDNYVRIQKPRIGRCIVRGCAEPKAWEHKHGEKYLCEKHLNEIKLELKKSGIQG